MRWKNLSIETDEQAQLPGYREPAVVRRFDAPEALKTNFYEVRAKSILNKVPAASRMPFRWTINPYRGCSHACVYCLSGDTQVSTADNRTRALRDLEVGEAIYGTFREGRQRRFVKTEVLAKWSSLKPAFFVELEDGSELVASEEHRFLTRRGWKHVTGAEHGPSQRPHLTVGTRLVGPGNAAAPAEGSILSTAAALKVKSIRPAGMVMRMYDITTGTGDFIANGVVSHNCFARPTHKYLGFDAGRDFEQEIVVKVNAPELLRAELARTSWKGEHVALGTNTDPYQWVEGRYRLMPAIWEALRDAANPCSILTKSPLLLRDLALMREINERTSFSAALSVPTLDEKTWRATEPHTPHPRARLEAAAELTRVEIRTGLLIAPLMPGVNDSPEQVEAILKLAAEAGVSSVNGVALHLRGDVRAVFFEWLSAQRPDLVPRYRGLYKQGAYAPIEERRRLARLIRGPDRGPEDRVRAAPDQRFARRDGSRTRDTAGGKAGAAALDPVVRTRAEEQPPQQRLF
jgi:DNA repair photolyase